MTPKELEILYTSIEMTAEEFFRKGYEAAKAGKPLDEQPFKLSKGNRLLIKTNLEKATKKR